MAKRDFSAVLERQVGTGVRMDPLPEGTYQGQIDGIPEFKPVQTKNGPRTILRFVINLLEAGDDVDPEELANAGGLTNDGKKPRSVFNDFWLTDKDELPGALDDFLAGFGCNAGSYGEAFDQVAGAAVTVALTLREYTDDKTGKERRVNDVARCFATA